MSRIPPALLYLTIFNPTLHPATNTVEDDEDAEEQAHVLFYTARERAVSRDKILRQVGLAKALINFTGMFNATDSCENIHSQSRRMIMVSPEPDFWIHACLELAKTPRQDTPKRTTSKGKGKEPVTKAELVFDYHDGSVGDLELKTHLLRGYELFKLTHGSFTSILTSLGQQALELQLERFFTVWAWKWDTDDESSFASYLGIPLHPSYRSLTPLMDDFTSKLSYSAPAFIIRDAQVVLSSSLSNASYARVLVGHIGTRIPPPPPPATLAEARSSTLTVVPSESGKDNHAISVDASPSKQSSKSADHIKLTLMPGVNLDVPNIKWSWPGYLTFGKPKPSTPSIPTTPLEEVVAPPQEQCTPDQQKPAADSGDAGEAKEETKVVDVQPPQSVNVDTESLQDAISSDHAHSRQPSSPTRSTVPSPPALPPSFHAEEQAADSQDEGKPADHAVVEGTPVDSIPRSDEPPAAAEPGTSEVGVPADDDARADEKHESQEESSAPDIPPPQFLPTTVYLADHETPTVSRKMRVWHATQQATTIALVLDYEHPQEQLPAPAEVAELFRDIQHAAEADEDKNLEASIPTVSKILVPRDKYIFSTGQFTVSSSSGFTSRSEHFFRGQQLLRELDAQEIFSRGQNPQHWYISRSGLGTKAAGGFAEGEAFMEIARKESTLTDVDNALAGAIRRFGES